MKRHAKSLSQPFYASKTTYIGYPQKKRGIINQYNL